MGYKKAALSGQLADVDLKLLRVFKAVVECGGISAAELKLNLANSTITNYLSDLEKRLGMHLCERGRRGFAMTDQGQRVYSASLELFNAMNHFRHSIHHSERLVGHLHLVLAEHTLGAPGENIVSGLSEFARTAPQVQLEVETADSDQVTNALLHQRADVGITVVTRDYSQLTSSALFEEQMLLYAHCDHPIFKDAEIDDQSLLAHSFAESPRLMRGRQNFEQSSHWHIGARAHHQEARLQLVLSGSYIAFLPRHLVEQWGVSSQLRTVMAHKYNYSNTFSLLYNRNSANKGLIEHFIRCING
ncbi:MAG: LysR family transcriptional regulator [Pseudomonadales bacterium]